MSDLFKPVDVKRTGKNVRHFFETDFDHLMKYASPLSTVSNNRPDRQMSTNDFSSKDYDYQEYARAKALANACQAAVKNCSPASRQIIEGVYCKGINNIQMQIRMNIGAATYSRWKAKAMVEFADALLAETQRSSHVKAVDLHKYLRED